MDFEADLLRVEDFEEVDHARHAGRYRTARGRGRSRDPLLATPEMVAGATEPEAEALLAKVDSGLTPGTVPPKYAFTKR